MTGIRIGGAFYASISEALRAVKSGETILLDPGTFSAPALLTFAQGTTLKGSGSRNKTILLNTPILERSGQGKFAPNATIQDLAFEYRNQSGYLFSPSVGSVPYNPINPTLTSFRLKDVAFTGRHQGNIGVSGTYMDISGAKNTIFDGIRVSLSGQAGFDASKGTGGGYFIFKEGGADIQIVNSDFNEASYSGAFIVLYVSDALIASNRFIGGGLIRQDDGNNPADNPRGERFVNAGGIFANNHLSNGAFFDFILQFNSDAGTVWTDYKRKFATTDGTFGLRTSVEGNTFDIIPSGYGILIRADIAPELVGKMLSISGNVFNNGLAIRSDLANPYDLAFGQNYVNGILFDNLRVGGTSHDQLNASRSNGRNWISGGLGNDQLYSSPGKLDAFVFYTPPNSQSNTDTILGFETGGSEADQIWLDAEIFRGLLSNGDRLDTRSFTTNTNGVANGSTGQIIYNSNTGELFYDGDGAGGNQTAARFAILSGKESIALQDFRLFNRTSSSPFISPAVISLGVSPANVKEDSNSTLVFNLTRTGPTTEPLTVNYTIGGSADASDYSGATPGNGKSITFGGGSSTATLTIAPKADETFEADESVSLTLNSGDGYSIGTTSVVTGSIANDDATSAAIDIKWIQLLGGPGNELGYAVATGPDGSIYVGGETNGGAWDGHTNRGRTDAFVSRFDLSGNRSWSRWFATDKNEDVRDLAVGKDGSLFVGGGTFGALDGNTSAGNSDGFLSRISPIGGKEWTIQFGGAENEYARRIVTTPDDTGIYTIGYTRGFAGLPAAAPGEGGPDAFVMKVAKDKSLVWATRIVNGLDDWGMDITVGNDGSIYALGFAGTAANRYQAFLSKLNPSNGSIQWTKLIGGSQNEYGISLTTGKDGFIYAAISLDDADIAIQKYSADGALIWQIQIGSSAEDRASDLITGPDGALYLTGKTLGNLGGQTNKGQSDAFICKISTQGQVEWTRLIGSSANDSGLDLAFAANGDLILVGETSGNLSGRNSSGGSDVFIASLSTGGPTPQLPSISFTQSGNEIEERGYSKQTYTFTRTGPLEQPLTISYSLSGSADQADYTGAAPGNKTLSFAVGSATASLVLTPINDGVREPDETIILTLNPQPGYQIIDPSSRISTIREVKNTEPVATFKATLSTTISSPTMQGNLTSLDPDKGDRAVYKLLTPAPLGFDLQENGAWSFNPLSYSNLAKGTTKTITLAYKVDDDVSWSQPALPAEVVRVGGPNSAYSTIQEAINRSPAGSILYIAPGTYNENLSINKEIHLLGAFYGIPATEKQRGQSGTETTIKGFINVSTSSAGITLDGLNLIGSAEGDNRGTNMRVQADSIRLLNTIITGVRPTSGGYASPAFVNFRKDPTNPAQYNSVVVENNLFQGDLNHSARPVPLQINNAKFAKVENNTFIEVGGGGNIVLASNFDEAIVRNNYTQGGGKGLATFNGIFEKLIVDDNSFINPNLNGTELNQGSIIRSGSFKGNKIIGSGIDVTGSKYSDVFANLFVSDKATIAPQFEIRDNDLSTVLAGGVPYRGIVLSSPQVSTVRRTTIETITLAISNPQSNPPSAIPLARPEDVARFDVSRFASGLGFPSSMVAWGDNSILAATTLGDSNARNSPYGSSPSQLVLLTDSDLDGTSDRQQILATLPGFVTSLRTAGNLIFALSTARPGPPTITIFRRGPSPTDQLVQSGVLSINFPAAFFKGDSIHTSYALAARPDPKDPNIIELYFNIGTNNENKSTDPSIKIGLSASEAVNFPGGTMPAESIQRVLIRDLGQTLSISAPRTIATGLRNAAGINFDPAGNLIFQDNGFSGDPDNPGAPYNNDISFSADELNFISASDIGVITPDFGFGKSYVRYSDGVTVNPSPSTRQPVISFLPKNGAKSEGAVEVSVAPTGFPSDFASTVFTNFYGKGAAGPSNNDENSVVVANPTTGNYFHFIKPGILGNPSGLLAAGDNLYLADFSKFGIFYGTINGTPADQAGVIYRISPKQLVSYTQLPSLSDINSTEVTLNWQSSADSNSIIELWEDSLGQGSAQIFTARSNPAGASFATSVTLGGLKSSTPYTFRTRLGRQETMGSFMTAASDGSVPISPTITLALAPSSVLEDGAANLIYTFTRTGATSNPLTVNYTVAGTANLGSDVSILGSTDTSTSRSITFAAGSPTASLTVDPTADSTVEPNETVEITLATGNAYSIATPNPVIGTITND
ncbi:MAG: Calx-beta domain-containing protein, partial [Cyanobium sp.]